ncbi:TIR domain-containing protein [Amycolatopsis sp. NPDC052450]|uniref:TIR domain-containing protein n=1 Tax=Amycolatopsis sp. NPDC052450 TaxID=3363937 RepID=UPI0037C86AE5
MGYEFDVYLSYSRRGNVPVWLFNHLLPNLRDALADEMPSAPDIFVDQNMAAGMDWPASLERALLRSRLMVAVLSPRYFVSEWCLAEWMTMSSREREGTATEVLIIPVVYSGDINFPDYARSRRWFDFKAWNIPHELFRSTREYGDFHRAVRQLAADIAERVKTVPEWDATWEAARPGTAFPSKLPRF